jgi:glyceraldehyde-3-phosphate dehydrogenase (NADP+)
VAAEFQYFLAGKPGRSSEPLDVRSPFDGSIVGRTWLAPDTAFDQAADAAVESAATMRELPAYERAAILTRAAAAILTRRDEIARTA